MSGRQAEIDDLRDRVCDESLARVLGGEADSGGQSLPHLSTTVSVEQYLRAVMDLHFHPEHGTPYWLDRVDELDFDPRSDVRSVEDLHRFPPADEAALRDAELRSLTPDYYGVTDLDVSNSSGTTGRKKSMPYGRPVTADMAAWYAWHVAQRSPTDGDWLVVGPYGLYERHLVSAANECGQACHFVGIEPKYLKEQAGALQQLTSGVGGFVRGLPRLPAALKGLVRFDATLAAAEDLVASQPVRHIASGVGIPQRLHSMLEERGPTDPEDVETLLLSGGHVPEERRELLAELYPNASIVPMYATSFTGACIDHPDTDHVAYYPMAPSAFLTVADEGGELVDAGERGRTVINRVGADFLWPMQIERETARREPPREPFGWGGIADIRPL